MNINRRFHNDNAFKKFKNALGRDDALDFVHRARDEVGRPLDIIHRDVTPKNMMIGFEGGVKLLDFGLAKSAANVGLPNGDSE